MKNPIKSTPKDVFLHLFNVVTFYLSVIGGIILYIQYINALFPDTLNYYFTNIANGVRTSSAILFIAVPAYIISSWMLSKDLIAVPEKRDLKLRKWLIYFTLFISAITIIVDLMIFVYNFLDGELTIRFFLKVLVVLAIAGAVFGYYIWELKRQDIKSKIPRILAIILGVFALGSIICGFFIVGTPGEQRDRKTDEQRIFDLQMIQSEVINYWLLKDALPEDLESLQNNISGFVVPKDPETQKPYEYMVSDALRFELCADFAISNIDELAAKRQPTMYYSPYETSQQNWQHETGRVCFERTIDPELYKSNKIEPTVIR